MALFAEHCDVIKRFFAPSVVMSVMDFQFYWACHRANVALLSRAASALMAITL
jgi:hypothetical protein